jgi:hypothetical protein
MKRKLALVVLVPMLLSAGQAQEAKKAEPKQLVQDVVLKQAEFDDIANVLHIFKKSGHVKLNADRNVVRLVMDFYKDGKKVGSIESPTEDVLLGPKQQKDRVEFCVQAIDMDHLTLGNGKKNHCRVLASVSIGGSYATSERDVDKAIFDFSKGGSSQQFEANAGSDKDILLFWVANNSDHYKGGSRTVVELIAAHPKANIAVCTLRIFE